MSRRGGWQVRQQQARSNKVREDAELADLIQLELQQKEKELKAGIQRERTQRELRKVKEGKLNELQDEKSRSLAMLEKEKEALRRREVRRAADRQAAAGREAWPGWPWG